MDGSTIGFFLWVWILVAPVLLALTTYTSVPNRSRMGDDRSTRMPTQTDDHPRV